MGDLLLRVIADIFTEKNSKTFCPVRTCGIIGFFAYLLLSFTELVRHCHDFNLIEAASGMSVILGILAGGVTIKSRGEDK